MLPKIISILIVIFWIALVTIYPMLISIYVILPLFVGFSGLMLLKGVDEDNYWYIIFSLVYMLNLETNLSLPLLLISISVLFFYFFIKPKLEFLKLCSICVSIVTVVAIDIIYFTFLAIYDFTTRQSSVDFDSLLLYSILYDIIAAVLI